MIISQIVAVSLNNVIGKNNALPWKMPTDMAYFKNTTWGHHIVTGRRNYEAEGKALPGRANIVLTRNADYRITDGIVVQRFDDAIAIASQVDEDELFVVGGSEIYRLAMPFTDKIYLTRIHAIVDGDTFYPEPDWNEWIEISRISHQKDENNPYDFDFIVYERKK
jgi:dihydrofolate reductase